MFFNKLFSSKKNTDTLYNTEFSEFNKKFSTPYTEKDRKDGIADPNILLGENLKLSLTGDKLTNRRNANVLVIGGSGSGKTISYVNPNIIQYNASVICSDPSGEIMATTGKGLLKNGYKLHLFSTSDMLHSDIFNPLDYIYTYDDKGNKVIDIIAIRAIVDTFMDNIERINPFEEKAIMSFLTFAILYLAEFKEPQNRNFYELTKLVRLAKYENGSMESELDKSIAESIVINPNAKCFYIYNIFKLAPVRTINSILTTLEAYLNPFLSVELRNLTTTDYLCIRDPETNEIIDYIKDKEGNLIPTNKNIDLHTLGDKKTALFISIPQVSEAYNFLAAMLFNTAYTTLYNRVEKVCPNGWNIYDKANNVIGANYSSSEEAERYRYLFSTAEIKEEKDTNGVEHYYIYNKEASADETLKEKAYLPSGMGGGTGYLLEIYNKDYALKFIKNSKNTIIKQGTFHLPTPVKIFMDEFASIGKLRYLHMMLVTCRKYWISVSIITQSIGQLKAMYGESYEILVDCCDTLIYLGSSEYETIEYMTKRLGNVSIKTKNGLEPTKKIPSYRYTHTQREAMFFDELKSINNTESVVIVRGVNKPFLVKKYNYFTHPNFKDTGDNNKDNKIDEKFIHEHFYCPQQPDLRNFSEKFHDLTRFIPVITDNDFGKWQIDHKNDGTSAHPKQLPFVIYSECVQELECAIYEFEMKNPDMELNKYRTILKSNGIEWSTQSMKAVDVSNSNAQVVLALLMGVVRAEHFCDGVLLDFLESGVILQWLKRLEKLSST